MVTCVETVLPMQYIHTSRLLSVSSFAELNGMPFRVFDSDVNGALLLEYFAAGCRRLVELEKMDPIFIVFKPPPADGSWCVLLCMATCVR
jgi:hypothetical protein